MLYKFLIAIAIIHLKCCVASTNQQVEYQSEDVASTEPSLSIIGIGESNVTFKWTKTGAWQNEDDFTVSIYGRKGSYRPIDVNASFNEFTDLLGNYNTTTPNYFCDNEACSCSFYGGFGFIHPYYKSCSDGVITVEAGGVNVSTTFTTSPSEYIGLKLELDANNLVVHWDGFKDSDEGKCGRRILLNIYQPVKNAGWTPQGVYWPGEDYYGNILHTITISRDTWESKYSLSLDPDLVDHDDETTKSAGAIIAYMDDVDEDLVTSNWNIGVLYYDADDSQSLVASVTTIVLASLLTLMFR